MSETKNLIQVDADELTRLYEIEALLAKCLYHSAGFVSCWEFDNHDMGVNPEEWWQELAGLIEKGGVHVFFCQRCGARTHPDGGTFRVADRTVCGTCRGEHDRGMWR